MADTKISALPASTTPLAGTEVLPIVQSGATKQVSVADLTAGRALSATQLTLSTGNLIVSSGQGIDFSATPGTGTSELFSDYEEGTWTPVIADATSGGNVATVGTTVARYTRIGRTVFVQASFDNINTTGMTAGSNVSIRGLPFANAAGNFALGSCVMSRVSYLFNSWRPQIEPSVSLVQFTEYSALNANYSTMTVANILASTSDIYFSITYTV
jgi:hypothetical protein